MPANTTVAPAITPKTARALSTVAVKSVGMSVTCSSTHKKS